MFVSFVTSGRHVIAVYCFMFAGGVASDRWPPSGSIRGMDILKPHATHPFGVRAVRLTHFVPSGDVLASGQPASLRSLGTSWQAPSQLSGFSGLSELSGFFQVFRSERSGQHPRSPRMLWTRPAHFNYLRARFGQHPCSVLLLRSGIWPFRDCVFLFRGLLRSGVWPSRDCVFLFRGRWRSGVWP